MSRSWWIAVLLLLCVGQRSQAQCPFGYPSAEELNRAIAKQLRDRRINVEFKDAPLRTVLADLGEMLEVPVLIDEEALQDEHIDADAPVSLEVDNLSVRSMLHLLLHQASLDYVLRDGKVLVTTKSIAHGPAMWQTYPVEAFLITEADYVDERSVEDLERLISSAISPESWEDVGGVGRIGWKAQTRSLAIFQVPDVQEQVQRLFDALQQLVEGRRFDQVLEWYSLFR